MLGELKQKTTRMGGFLFGFLCFVPSSNIEADKHLVCRLSVARSVAQAKPPRTRKARSASKEPKKRSEIATRGDYATVEGRAHDSHAQRSVDEQFNKYTDNIPP